MPAGFPRFLADLPRGRAIAPRRSLCTAWMAVAMAAAGAGAGSAIAQQATPAAAEAAASSEIENAKYSAEGTLTRAEFVRALPGDKFYATQRMDKGAKVTVVGSKGDWLKIIPPDGSFSYVNRAFVERFGNGKQGRVTASNLLVKAGSSMQSVMWITQAKLNPKDVVEILGEDDQYFKIKPPEGAYLYLPKDAVARVAEAPAAGPVAKGPETPAIPEAPAAAPETPAAGPTTGPVTSITPTPGSITPAPESPAIPETPGTPAPETPAAVTPEAPEAPKPLTAAEALPALQALEVRFTLASQQPLQEQPLAELIGEYERVSAAPGLHDTARRIVEIRLATLKVRSDALEQLKLAQKKQEEDESRALARKMEREETAQALKRVEIQRFTAVGTLRTSSLQVARTQLYRLTDPRTGRTLVYIWGTDPKVATLVDQFVGVGGDVQTDNRLQFKVINPTGVEAVDASKVNTAIAAEIVPPSLQPRTPTATTVTPERE